jgi:hypothetical protein
MAGLFHYHPIFRVLVLLAPDLVSLQERGPVQEKVIPVMTALMVGSVLQSKHLLCQLLAVMDGRVITALRGGSVCHSLQLLSQCVP